MTAITFQLSHVTTKEIEIRNRQLSSKCLENVKKLYTKYLRLDIFYILL